MAIRLCNVISSRIPTRSHDPNKCARNRSFVTMCAANPTPPGLRIKLYNHNKIEVFEGLPDGIVCYEDASGELICEGYDEGPRFSHQMSGFSSNSSGEVEIIDLLQRCWIHASDEREFETAEAEFAGQKDFQL